MRLCIAAAFFGACAFLGYHAAGAKLLAWFNRPPDPPAIHVVYRLKPEYAVEFRTFFQVCFQSHGADFCAEQGRLVYGAAVVQIAVGDVFVDCSERLSPLHVATCRNAGWRP